MCKSSPDLWISGTLGIFHTRTLDPHSHLGVKSDSDSRLEFETAQTVTSGPLIVGAVGRCQGTICSVSPWGSTPPASTTKLESWIFAVVHPAFGTIGKLRESYPRCPLAVDEGYSRRLKRSSNCR
jgi:hypothetical protein